MRNSLGGAVHAVKRIKTTAAACDRGIGLELKFQRGQCRVIREDCLGHQYRHQTPPTTCHDGTSQMQSRMSSFLSLAHMKISFKNITWLKPAKHLLHIKKNKLPQSTDWRLNWSHFLWHVTNMQKCDMLKRFKVVTHRYQRNNPNTVSPD